MRLIPYKLIFVFLLFSIISCTPHTSKTDKASSVYPVKPLIVFNNKDDGWGGDVRISITDITEDDSSEIYKAVSVYQNKKLGLLVTISKAKENSQGFGKNINFKSIGSESDNLLSLLALLYQQKISANTGFVKSISVGYVDLNKFAKSVTGMEDKTNLNTKEYKLFFATKDDVAELFFNVNEDEKWIELREKDKEFRPAIIKVLSQ